MIDLDNWQNPDKFCAVCNRRIWPMQRGIRVYSLGNNRAHIACAASYLHDELGSRFVHCPKCGKLRTYKQSSQFSDYCICVEKTLWNEDLAVAYAEFGYNMAKQGFSIDTVKSLVRGIQLLINFFQRAR